MLKHKLVLGTIMLSLLTLIAGACATEASEFEDVKWFLESYGEPGNLHEVLEGTQITATFESAESQVRGSAGCNSYFGDYEIKGNKLTIGQVGSTEMYCMEPEGVMEQETEYLKALQTVRNFEMVDGKLRIYSEEYELLFRIE